MAVATVVGSSESERVTATVTVGGSSEPVTVAPTQAPTVVPTQAPTQPGNIFNRFYNRCIQ